MQDNTDEFAEMFADDDDAVVDDMFSQIQEDNKYGFNCAIR